MPDPSRSQKHEMDIIKPMLDAIDNLRLSLDEAVRQKDDRAERVLLHEIRNISKAVDSLTK